MSDQIYINPYRVATILEKAGLIKEADGEKVIELIKADGFTLDQITYDDRKKQGDRLRELAEEICPPDHKRVKAFDIILDENGRVKPEDVKALNAALDAFEDLGGLWAEYQIETDYIHNIDRFMWERQTEKWEDEIPLLFEEAKPYYMNTIVINAHLFQYIDFRRISSNHCIINIGDAEWRKEDV